MTDFVTFLPILFLTALGRNAAVCHIGAFCPVEGLLNGGCVRMMWREGGINLRK